ncbi:hypothetical protein MPSEU_000595900 [Mayamaea pseudoterrestris]|nr:hypothetical protein MPSEU_000595900 [Mayamaea pseudoterrestris]
MDKHIQQPNNNSPQRLLLCMFSSLRTCQSVDEAAFESCTQHAQLTRNNQKVSLYSLRNEIQAALQHNSYRTALDAFPSMQAYVAAVGALPNARIELKWKAAAANGQPEVFGSLHWDRCNMLWNMVVLLAYQSTTTALTSNNAASQTKASSQQQQQPFWYLQAAASLCQTLRNEVQELLSVSSPSTKHDSTSSNTSLELSPIFLKAWQELLLAHAQRSTYETFRQLQLAQRQPRHFLLAQLASAAVPLFGAAEASIEKVLQNEHVLEQAEQQQAAASNGVLSFFGLMDVWNQATQAWGMYLNSMAEYHEALKHKQTNTQQQQQSTQTKSSSNKAPATVSPIHLARLQAAIRYAELAQVFLDQADEASDLSSSLSSETQRLDALVRDALEQMQNDLVLLVPDQNAEESAPFHDDAYEHPAQNKLQEELPAIRPQQTVKLMQMPEGKVLPSLEQLKYTMSMSDASAESPLLLNSSSHRTPPSSSHHYPPMTMVMSNRQTPPSVLSSPAVSAGLTLGAGGISSTGSSNLSPSTFQRYRQSFLHQLMDLHEELTTLAQTKTEAGRQALTAVDLPQSLTAYHREQQQLQQLREQQQHEKMNTAYARRHTGRLPPQLWARVATLQQQRSDPYSPSSSSSRRNAETDHVASLQQQLWELRDSADVARGLLKQMDLQLQEDLEMDRTFRQDAKHAEFAGHDVLEVQRAVRENLSHYAGLLQTAQESDDVLWEQCQSLDTDPKFQLLKFDKEQLEHLIEPMPSHVPPPMMDGGAESRNKLMVVSNLSKHLVELSALFEMRESNLQTMHRRINDFPFEEELLGLITSGVRSEQALSTAVEQAKEVVQVFVDKVEASIERQADLLRNIMQDNEEFVRIREASQPIEGGNCIAKLEDALDEIDVFAKHLKEGKDFYDVVIPKLDRLKTQVEDVSARLTIERMEYEDRIAMSRQEADDARMAARFAEQQQQQQQQPQTGPTNGAPPTTYTPSQPSQQRISNSYYGGNTSTNSSSNIGNVPRHEPAGHPGVEQVDHMSPMVRVDDSKVATLMAMDFDPDKVVAALRLYDNNFDQALNALLSG